MRRLTIITGGLVLTLAFTSAAWTFPVVRMPRPTVPSAAQIRALATLNLLNRGGVRNPGLHVTTTHIDLELEADDATKVRTDFLPEIFDEKGKPKRYTKDEVAALKGGSSLPGFKAGYDDIKQGQVVRVVFGKRDEEKKKDDEKKDDKDKKNDQPKPVSLPVNELLGKITRVEGTTKKFVVRVDIKTLANPIVAALNNASNKDNDKDQEIPVDRKVALVVIETPDPAGKEKK
jgi:hypothetical protein